MDATRWIKMARLDGTICPLCRLSIARGGAIFPSDDGGWAHLSCCIPSGSTVPRTPRCKHGATCAAQAAGHCVFAHNDTARDGRVPVLGDRATALRRWLLATFGAQRLNEGTGVLDGAAGKGALTWQLQTLSGVAAFAYEPRPLELENLERKLAWGMCQRDARATGSASAPIEHVRLFFEYSTAEGLAALADEAAFAAATRRARAVRLSAARHGWRAAEGSDAEDSAETLPPSSDAEDDAVESACGSWNAPRREPRVREVARARAADLVARCSVVVGMHPDQATESLVDFALRHGKPFAVVPCCVHSKDARFAARTVAAVAPEREGVGEGSGGVEGVGERGASGGEDGDRGEARPARQAVRSFESFLRYLRAKAPGVRTATLPMRGRNTVVYYLGAGSSAAAV